MNMTLKRIAMATGVSVVALGATPAFATGTTAGTSINNTATVNYQVGGVSQTAIDASNTFTVDRKIDLVVAELANVTTSVAPGSTAQVTTFTVRNTSNATLDLGLTVTQQTGGTATHGGTDTFDVTTPSLFVDTNGNNTYDAGTDTAVTFLDELAADTQRTVFIVANIPINRVNGDVAGVRLTAQAREAGTAGTQGAVVTQTAGANTAGVDTVFADAADTTPGNVASDGQSFDDDDYTVSAPVLTVAKQSRVISDPVNGTTNPKFIPGALVEYCIVVSNAATASSAANSVAISDPLPAQTTYETTYGIFVGGTYTGTPGSGTCNLDGTAGGAFATGTVSGTLGSIAAGSTRTLYFRVRIN